MFCGVTARTSEIQMPRSRGRLRAFHPPRRQNGARTDEKAAHDHESLPGVNIVDVLHGEGRVRELPQPTSKEEERKENMGCISPAQQIMHALFRRASVAAAARAAPAGGGANGLRPFFFRPAATFTSSATAKPHVHPAVHPVRVSPISTSCVINCLGYRCLHALLLLFTSEGCVLLPLLL